MRLAWLLVVLLIVSGVSRAAFADARAACIAACEKPAVACADSSRTAKTKCVGSVRESCRAEPLAKRPGCLSAASKACSETHNPAIEACDTTFAACHKGCFGEAPVTRGYWCRHEADLAGEVTRKTGYCDLEQSQASLDQCLKRFDVAAKPGSVVTVDCQPL